ncbi:MAG: DUF2846 domain-containing protein [Desulfovibrio sp.]|nr:DUF2846 domain-containing protein [Desulfovibrio sp.]
MKKLLFVLMVTMVIAMGAGCSKMPVRGDYILEKTPPQITSEPDKATIFFYRHGWGYFGAGTSYFVEEDGKQIGLMKYKTYFVYKAQPGQHVYALSTESTANAHITVEASKTYYLECGLHMGFLVGRPSIREATQTEFEKVKNDLEYIRLSTQEEKEAFKAKESKPESSGVSM